MVKLLFFVFCGENRLKKYFVWGENQGTRKKGAFGIDIKIYGPGISNQIHTPHYTVVSTFYSQAQFSPLNLIKQ